MIFILKTRLISHPRLRVTPEATFSPQAEFMFTLSCYFLFFSSYRLYNEANIQQLSDQVILLKLNMSSCEKRAHTRRIRGDNHFTFPQRNKRLFTNTFIPGGSLIPALVKMCMFCAMGGNRSTWRSIIHWKKDSDLLVARANIPGSMLVDKSYM